MKKQSFYLYFLSVCIFSMASLSNAHKMNQVEGNILKIAEDTFSIQSELGVFEFPKGKTGVKLPIEARVGDVIQVWYTTDVVKIEVHQITNKGGSLPGQIAPTNRMSPQIDDRAFYTA